MDYGQPYQVWEEYKHYWKEGSSNIEMEMNFDTFCDLFEHGEISREAAELVEKSKFAFQDLRKVLVSSWSSLYRVFKNYHRIRILLAVRGEDFIDKIIIDDREKFGAITARVSLIRHIIDGCTDYCGRRWIRNRLNRWWHEADFVEEEKEGLLRGLAENKVLNWGLVSQLRPDAVETVKRLIRRYDIKPEYIDGFDVEVLRSIQGTKSVDWLSSRIGMLLQPVTASNASGGYP